MEKCENCAIITEKMQRIFIMEQPISIDATIKLAFRSVIKIIENKLERTKSQRTSEEYANLKNDVGYLRGIASNPEAFFNNKKESSDIFTELGKLLDISILSGYSLQYFKGTRLLDSLMLYANEYYNAEEWNTAVRNESMKNILALNKIIQLKSATGLVRAVGLFRSLAPAENFAMREEENQK